MTQPNQFPPVTADRLEKARALFADGASQMEVVRSTGLARETLLKYLPKAGWSHREAGQFGRVVRTAKQQGLL